MSKFKQDQPSQPSIVSLGTLISDAGKKAFADADYDAHAAFSHLEAAIGEFKRSAKTAALHADESLAAVLKVFIERL